MAIELYIEEDNNIYWLNNGRVHNNFGPAGRLANGTKFWYSHGQRHRLDGPAAEHSFGLNEYWFNGVKNNDYLECLVVIEQYNLIKENKC